MSEFIEESKNKFIYVIVSVLLTIAVAVGGVAFYLKDTRGNIGGLEEIRVVVSTDGSTSTTLSVENLKLLPAGSAEYEVALVCEEAGEYLFRLKFEEKAASALKNYVSVAALDGETRKELAQISLKDAFDGGAITFKREMQAETESKILLRYTMAREAGNDAQGAEAAFDIVLTAQKV